MSEWKEYKLSEITEPVKDTFNPIGGKDFAYIGLEHIEQETLRLNSVGVSSDVTSNKFKFKANDILFGKLRPYFRKVVKPNFDGICSTDIWVFRSKNGVDQNFLYYFLANWDFVDTANGADTGTRMPRADWQFLQSTEWQIPPLPEQQSIAAILSSLDDKIDLLHRQNKTLEQLAETLFRQWFVVEAEEGWETKKLEDIILFDPREKVSSSVEYTFFDMRGLSNDSMSISDGIKRSVGSGSSFRNWDTLLAKITPCLENGKTGFVMNLEDNEIARGSTEFIVMRPKEGVSPYFVYCLARSSDFRDTAILSMTGTSGRQRVQPAMLKNYEIKSSQNVMKEFHEICKPQFAKIRQNQIQIRTLTQLRDTLLPKLMSGEVRVN